MASLHRIATISAIVLGGFLSKGCKKTASDVPAVAAAKGPTLPELDQQLVGLKRDCLVYARRGFTAEQVLGCASRFHDMGEAYMATGQPGVAVTAQGIVDSINEGAQYFSRLQDASGRAIYAQISGWSAALQLQIDRAQPCKCPNTGE